MLVHGKEQLTTLGCRSQFQKFNTFAPSWQVSRGLPDMKKRKVFKILGTVEVKMS